MKLRGPERSSLLTTALHTTSGPECWSQQGNSEKPNNFFRAEAKKTPKTQKEKVSCYRAIYTLFYMYDVFMLFHGHKNDNLNLQKHQDSITAIYST